MEDIKNYKQQGFFREILFSNRNNSVEYEVALACEFCSNTIFDEYQLFLQRWWKRMSKNCDCTLKCEELCKVDDRDADRDSQTVGRFERAINRKGEGRALTLWPFLISSFSSSPFLLRHHKLSQHSNIVTLSIISILWQIPLIFALCLSISVIR